MRTTLIASSVAAVALVGLAGGAALAAGSSGTPAATPTTLAPGMDIFADMGLTPEQGDCLVANVGGVDMNDLTALTELMTQCGISMEQLVEIGQNSGSTTVARDPATTTALASTGTLDGATIAAVFEIMGLDETAVGCLVEGASTAAPTDDQSAELVFIGCGIGPLLILDAIVALDAQSGDITAETTTTVAGAPTTTVGSSGNAMVDLLLAQFAERGITLDPEQAQCLLDNISELDPSDVLASAEVFGECEIDIADLVPSG